jgi:chorismate synthase
VRKVDGRLGTATDCSGGVRGGITDEDIYFRIGFKSTQETAQHDETGSQGPPGVRHDLFGASDSTCRST